MEQTPTDPITVIVVDDAPEVRHVLARLLASDERLRVVGMAADADGAIALAQATQPDLAVVDVRMPGGGVAACRGIPVRSPATRVVALSTFETPELRRQMAEAGAVGYLTKGGMDDIVDRLVALAGPS
jgi:DNA-binding NarL/FixJ family response regulator